ncbi:hypothetical protein PRIPAC_77103 [Pristionchus pacificus]|uniref:Uncharacterized protein n=1 Tax=Pristionchus pacificus TaxID=54126 RepID=A0A2A6CK89_PRIPA|nr:hypothetical protein PRIPAC_77103 [Pristionchus pacificus]|eukprot:PDM78473.1 hypothetical protein PRIPAC_31052 [Pristionchus pacificus]
MPIVDVTAVQLQVARAMIHRSRGLTTIINLGDNFYFTGVMSDDDIRFQTTFENVYRDTRVPWLTIAGNHDHMGNVQAQVSYTAKSKLWFALFGFPSQIDCTSHHFANSTQRWNFDSTVEFVMLNTVELCGNTVGEDPQTYLIQCESKNHSHVSDMQSGNFYDFPMDYLRRASTANDSHCIR